MTENKKTIVAGKFIIGQDWASVVTGFILILVVLIAGYNVGTPSFGGKAGWSSNQDMPGIFSASSLWISLLSTLLVFGIITVIGVILSGDSLKKFITGFLTVFLLAVLAQFISSYAGFKNIGLETVLFSLVLGLIIGNIGKLPGWLRPGVLTELYVKIGLVLLGATILFKDILTAGSA